MSAHESRPCRRCGMPIEIHEGPNGKPLPLQRVRSVYGLRLPLYGGTVEKLDADATLAGLYVSHFETCPNAGEFSRKGKRDGS